MFAPHKFIRIGFRTSDYTSFTTFFFALFWNEEMEMLSSERNLTTTVNKLPEKASQKGVDMVNKVT